MPVDAELVGQQAAEHGGVALPGRLHVEAEDQPVAAGKRQRGAFGRRGAGMFEHAGDADAAQLLAPRRLALALVEILVVGKLQRLVEEAGKIAAVVGGADRGLVGHRRGRNEILPAQPHGVDAGDARGFLDRAIERVVRLRPAGAAIGPDRRRVGEARSATEKSILGMRYMPGRQRAKLLVLMLTPAGVI